ncbi:glycerophosphodiester phosphodiesterase family protein [Fodinicurvata fenggangensis]|uniref:glycerophosphodiester phosphodiesterase family protein n=1 Tax=Fodinicurvata fenggangensis TaxID=1121830 RepID=UPI00068A5694|nr:glycerophosphodiester phosphodiesterase family protein [Fodinicurvata fenggangensis]
MKQEGKIQGMKKLPKIIGHRGAAGLAPENTLAGFRKTVETGVRMIELDAKLTSDSHVIVFHDETLERTTDGQGAVAETSYEAIAKLDAGRWFAPEYEGTRVPLLSDTLDYFRENDIAVNVEIKPCPGRERETALKTLEVLAAHWSEDAPLVVISSFQRLCLDLAQEQAPHWPRALLTHHFEDGWKEAVKELKAYSVHGNFAAFGKTRAMDVQLLGAQAAAYTVNDIETTKILFSAGVDSIITDRPDMLAAWL